MEDSKQVNNEPMKVKEKKQQPKKEKPERSFGFMQILGLLLVTVVITVFITVWAVKKYVFPTEFTPVKLSEKEEAVLNSKLKQLGSSEATAQTVSPDDKDRSFKKAPDGSFEPLEPEPYSEDKSKREIILTEKELNALLAKNTDLAKKLAIDLSENLVSAKLLLPMDEDLPIIGGKTLRVRTGVELAYKDDRPIVILKGVTVMGVPMPNAWLGGLKNIDLVKEFGNDTGFWKTLSGGLEAIHVKESYLKIKLKE